MNIISCLKFNTSYKACKASLTEIDTMNIRYFYDRIKKLYKIYKVKKYRKQSVIRIL